MRSLHFNYFNAITLIVKRLVFIIVFIIDDFQLDEKFVHPWDSNLYEETKSVFHVSFTQNSGLRIVSVHQELDRAHVLAGT